MNELAVKQESSVAISDSTKELIKHGVSKNTLAAYGRALTKWDTWLSTVVSPRELNDAVLAEYLTHLHESGKSPATISQVVAAVKWQSTNVNRQIVGAITTRTLSGIRRDGRDRGRGQYRGRESTLAIHSSKTDQEGKGESLYIGEPTRKAINKYCSCSAVRHDSQGTG